MRRSSWHTCPCCVGNIPRTLLMVPTWAYAKSQGGLYVNLSVARVEPHDEQALRARGRRSAA